MDASSGIFVVIFKILGLFLGLQDSYIKYYCFLCPRGSRADDQYSTRKECQTRKKLVPGTHNVSYNFSYKNQQPGYSNRLIKIYTEFGLCYAYNSQIAKIVEGKNLPKLDDGRIDIHKMEPPIRVSYLESGRPRSVTAMNSGFIVYFVSTWDLPTFGSGNLLITEQGGMYHRVGMSIEIISLVATKEVKITNINRRQCRFYDESNLKISPVYTKHHCHAQCRMDLATKHCGCVPFFYEGAVEAGYKICDIKGMLCLQDISVALVKVTGKAAMKMYTCKCYPGCESDNYKLSKETQLSTTWEPKYGGTTLAWQIGMFPRIRSKRDVIFTFSDLLIAFGGTAGLFLGFSVLSLVEIMYNVTLRLFFHIRDTNQLRKQNINKRRIINY
ncbi:hypothetical protein L9F63_016556 [Diploptera punctata]|uniref:Sodium channel protein Nach n=1 Tax=Diploptera punctata TaxID=6984 RepID=A0AAD8EI49_DIPPU|nr:hypothetical protein L9F63_016556 [Diploptera punctata]